MLRKGRLGRYLVESGGGVAGSWGEALALCQDRRLGLRRLQRLALRHQLQRRRVRGWRVMG